MHGVEVVAIDVGAHLDADVVGVVEIPGRGVADHLAVARPGDLAALPEGLRQGRDTHGDVEVLARLDHLQRVVVGGLEQFSQVIGRAAALHRGHHVIDVAPLLRPHVAEQIGADRALVRLDRIAVFGVQPPAHIAVQVLVERLHLRPQPVGFGGEGVRRHVVARAPQGAGVGVAQLARALVGDGDHAGVVGLHHRRDGAPALVQRLCLRRIAAVGQDQRGLVQGDRLALVVELAGRVGRVQPGGDVGQLVGGARPVRRRQHQRLTQQVQLAPDVRGHFHIVEAGGAVGGLDAELGHLGVDLGLQPHGVEGDVGGPRPGDARGVFAKLGVFRLGVGDKGGRAFGGRRIGRAGGRGLRQGCRGRPAAVGVTLSRLRRRGGAAGGERQGADRDGGHQLTLHGVFLLERSQETGGGASRQADPRGRRTQALSP